MLDRKDAFVFLGRMRGEIISAWLGRMRRLASGENAPFPETTISADVVAFEKEGPDRETSGASSPFSYGSEVCRLDHFLRPDFRWWCDYLRNYPRFHRKLWEWTYICTVLKERGMLAPGRRGLGFGVGGEPLTDAFASFGAHIVATDQAGEAATGWRRSGEFAAELSDLAKHGICDPALFAERVRYETADMNAIGDHLREFDFCWSSCALEHIGSLAHGIEFVHRSLDTLRPGGVAVHTTEFNLSSDDATIDEPDLAVFRRRDIVALAEALRAEGHHVAPLVFWPGAHAFDQYVDLPPYRIDLHLRLRIGAYDVSSIGLTVVKAG